MSIRLGIITNNKEELDPLMNRYNAALIERQYKKSMATTREKLVKTFKRDLSPYLRGNQDDDEFFQLLNDVQTKVYDQSAEKMANEIIKMGGQIHFNSKVEGIYQENNEIKYIVVNGEKIEGDYYISSMPIKDLVNGLNDVNDEVKHIAINLPYRDFITVGLLLNKLEIENKTKFKTVNNIVPDCWIYIQERDVKVGRLQVFNNWSPYMVDDINSHVFVGLEYFCSEGDEMWNMEKEKFIEFAIDELAKINIIRKEDVIDSCQIKIKKAYPAYFDTYSEFDKVKNYLNNISNLYCIGRNGQHRYNNMDHSMLTAIETVNVIKNNLDKSIIWNVNTEKEYHEENK